MLYGQMAIAAYACPRLVSAAVMDVSTMSIAPAVDNEAQPGPMDLDAQKLCAEHCNYGHQSDQAPNLALPPAVLLTSLYVALSIPSVSSQPAADLSALAEGKPPLAILHCCFRI